MAASDDGTTPSGIRSAGTGAASVATDSDTTDCVRIRWARAIAFADARRRSTADQADLTDWDASCDAD